MNSNIDDNASFQIDEFYLDLQQDGSKLKNLSEEEIIKNPFPGLRPFKTSEQDLFYGRKEQTNELIVKLAATNFLAVIGSSGTGKSSLVRAGLIPALFGGNIAYKGSDWKIAICRPGNDPVRNLSIALASTMAGSNDHEKVLQENKIIEPLLRSSSYGILDVKELIDKQHNQSNRQNLLIIIDQFEELFRFDRKELKHQNILYQNIESDFVKLLLQCKSDVESIFVVITMRSEFLGDCVKFRGLPEAINKSQYLVPQLEREQLTKVIKGPVQRAGKNISPDLIEILINEIESEKLKENLDQLPILQHALMRTYDEAFKKQENNDEMLYAHYKKIGEMKGALAQHAQEVFDKLDDKAAPASEKNNTGLSRKQQIAKIIFQALTDAISDQKGGRRPTELQNIYDILKAKAINASEAEADEVINYFRHADTSFIMPPSNTKLYPGLMLDISHESLMRNWPELKSWMKEEVKAAILYERLNQSRYQYEGEVKEFGKSDTYIRGILLTDLKEWQKSGLYNAAWAKRYHKVQAEEEDAKALYKRNLEYLKSCQKEINKEKKRKKTTTAVLISIALLALIATTYAYNQTRKAKIATLEKIASDADKAKAEAASKTAQADADKAKAEANEKAAKADAEKAMAEARSKQAQIIAEQAKARQAVAEAEAIAYEKAFDTALLKVSDLVRNLTQEYFYKSALLDPTAKNKYLDNLIQLRYGRNHNLQEYEELLKNLNTFTAVKDLAQTDPNKAVLVADHLRDSTKSRFFDSCFSDILNTNLIYTQKITLSKELSDNYSISRAPSAISANRNLFAVALDNSLKVYRVNNDSLHFLKNIILKKDTAGIGATGPDTLAFINNDSIIAFLKNRIYSIDLSKNECSGIPVPGLAEAGNYERYYTSTISPDGKKLATDYKDYNVRIWSIDHNFDTTKIALDPFDGYVDAISFSDDNKTLVVKQRFNTLKVPVDDSYNLASKNKVTYIYAGFTPDNKYVITHPRNSVLELHNLSPDAIISTLNFSDIRIDTFKNATFSLAMLTPDWKKLIIKTKESKDYQNVFSTYFFERNDKDSIFQFRRTTPSKDSISGKLIKLNYLNNSGLIVNDSNIISTSNDYDNDSITVWRKPENVTSESKLDLLINKLNVITTTEESIVIDSINADTITDIDYLKNAGVLALKKDARLLQKQTLRDAKKIYARLATLDPLNYLSEYRRLSTNYFTYYADTVERVNDLKKITGAGESLFKTTPLDSIKRSLASDYWNLSWYLVFKKDYDSAVLCAKRGLELNPVNNGINTNIALAYLLGGQCELANAVYKKYKDQQYLSDERKFNDAFLQDLNDLEYAGIITPYNKEVYMHVQRVRNFLNGKTNTLDCQ